MTASASRTRRSRSAAARYRALPPDVGWRWWGALQLGPQVAHRRFRLAPERGRPGRAAHSHPILRDPVQAGHPGTDQDGEAVDQEPFQYLAVADAEVGQRLGIHTDAAAQPLVGDVLIAQPRQLAGAANAIGRGIQPQRQQDARVRRRMARSTLHRLDRRHQRRHGQPLDKVPHHPDAVVGRHQIVQANRPQFDLAPFRHPQPRLVLVGPFRRRVLRQACKLLPFVTRSHRSTAKWDVAMPILPTTTPRRSPRLVSDQKIFRL